MDRGSSLANSLSQSFLGGRHNIDQRPHEHGQSQKPSRISSAGPMVGGSGHRPVCTVWSELGHRVRIRNDTRYAPTSLFQCTRSHLTYLCQKRPTAPQAVQATRKSSRRRASTCRRRQSDKLLQLTYARAHSASWIITLRHRALAHLRGRDSIRVSVAQATDPRAGLCMSP